MLNFLNGFRKWSLATLFMAVAVTLLVLGYLPAEGWIESVSQVIAAFMATNIGEHVIGVTRDWLQSRDLKTVMAKMDADLGKSE